MTTAVEVEPMAQPLIRPARWLALSLLLAGLALALVSWPPGGLALDVARPGGQIFLRDFHGDERGEGRSYRWTRATSTVVVPGMGGAARARLTLTASGQGAPAPVPLTVLFDGQAIGQAVVGPSQAYVFEGARPDARRDEFIVTLQTPIFRPTGDARDLGVIVERLSVESTAPASAPLAWLGRMVLLGSLAGLLGLAAWPLRRWLPTAALVAAAGLLVAVAALVGRPWLLAGWPWLAGGLGLAALAARPTAVADWGVRGLRGLTRPRLALLVMALGMLAHGALLISLAARIDWIGHADYADNAVVARNLVAGRGYTVDYVAQFYLRYPPTISHPADVWPLLQPTLIAGSFLLFGVSTFAAKLPTIAFMIGLLGASFAVGRALFGSLAGLGAAALLALDEWFFQNALFPVNDVGFSLLALLLVALAWQTGERERTGARPALGRYVALGVLAGLLFAAKPSGLLLAAGLAGWWLWERRPGGAVPWPGWRLVTVGLAAAALVAAPIVLRGLLTYGRPYFTTESFDAWVLKWDPPDENIYRLMTDEPPHPRQLVGYGVDRAADALALQFRKFGADISAGRYLEPPLLLLAGLGLALARPPARRQAAALLWMTVPYLLFVQVYWHYELRYYVFLIPWLALFAAGSLAVLARWVWERGDLAQQRLALAGLALGMALLLPARIGALADHAARLTGPSGDAMVGAWLAANTEPDAVIMTRLPWQMTWHSGRRSVMIPLATGEEIAATMREYGVDYLLLDHVNDRRTRREALQPLYEGRETTGFTKVYEAPNRNYYVYRVPASVTGVR